MQSQPDQTPGYTATPGPVNQPPPTKSKTGKILTIALAAAVAAGAAAFSRQCTRGLFGGTKTYSESSAKWQRLSPANTGLSLELPGEPEVKNIETPAEARRLWRDFKFHVYDGGDFLTSIGFYHAADDVELDPQSGARGSAEEMKKMKGITNFTYSVQPTASGANWNGSFKQGEDQYECRGVVVTSGQKMWGVTTLYKSANSDARAASQRVLGSLQY